MLDWERDQCEIGERIESHQAILKILLKTKNNPFFLTKWIEHHLTIVGPRNLIIFDNGSADPNVHSAYERFSDVIELILYNGYHNNLHYTSKFSKLYDALYHSCQYFIFLDTDEFLALFQDGRFYSDGNNPEFLTKRKDFDVFPGTWLYNTDWNATRFICGRDRLISGLKWGKPILRAQAKLNDFINHNVQLDKALCSNGTTLNLFVFHMAQLIPRQRIAANVNKLIACKFASSLETPEEIAACDLSDTTDSNIIGWVGELRRHL